MKMKTRKIVAKRFNITANGKILRRSQGTRHLRSNKNKRQLRKLGQIKVVNANMTAAIKSFVPYL